MIKFEEVADLAYYMLDLPNRIKEKHVAAIVYEKTVKDLLFYLLAEDVDFFVIDADFENYDKEYLVELSSDEDGFNGCIIHAYNYDTKCYIAPAANYILIDEEVPDKCLIDIISNPYSSDNPNFHRFNVEDVAFDIHDESDDYEDCYNCPERFECPYVEIDDADEDEDKNEDVTLNTDGVTILKNTDGTIRGFTKMKSFTDENNVHTSSSHSFFSDDVNAIKAAAKSLGIEL